MVECGVRVALLLGQCCADFVPAKETNLRTFLWMSFGGSVSCAFDSKGKYRF